MVSNQSELWLIVWTIWIQYIPRLLLEFNCLSKCDCFWDHVLWNQRTKNVRSLFLALQHHQSIILLLILLHDNYSLSDITTSSYSSIHCLPKWKILMGIQAKLWFHHKMLPIQGNHDSGLPIFFTKIPRFCKVLRQ